MGEPSAGEFPVQVGSSGAAGLVLQLGASSAVAQDVPQGSGAVGAGEARSLEAPKAEPPPEPYATGAISKKRASHVESAGRAVVVGGTGQAEDDQAVVILDLCSHVQRIMYQLGSNDVSVLPASARDAIGRMKAEMVVFASAGESPRDVARVDQTAVSRLDDSSLSESLVSVTGTSGLVGEDEDSPPVFRASRGRRSSVGTGVNRGGGLRGLQLEGLSVEERLVRALERLDNRKVPTPEPFDAASGFSFSDFLDTFEEYCRHTFCGRDRSWVGELGRFLVGDMHDAFIAHRAPSDSYASIKNKLVKWHREAKMRRQAGSKAMFNKASMKPYESLRLYAPRLENLFRCAYPQKPVETSQALQDKYLETIPKKYGNQIKGAISLTWSVNGKKLLWSQIVTLAGGLEEALAEPKVPEPSGPSAWQVVDTSRPALTVASCDAATQYYVPGWEDAPVDTMYAGNRSSKSALGPAAEDSRIVPLSHEERERAMTCHHCGRLGHAWRNCRRRLGLCLSCGSGDHHMASCPDRASASGRGRASGSDVRWEAEPGRVPGGRPGGYSGAVDLGGRPGAGERRFGHHPIQSGLLMRGDHPGRNDALN